MLIEEFLEGQEASLLTLVDGETILPLAPAQDYKRIGDGDVGPNTGGMGSYCPVPALDPATYNRVVEEVLKPSAYALVKRGIHFRGILYAGVILTADGPKVLEYNVRFGDPETQAVLPRLSSDLLEAMLAVAEGRLAGLELDWSDEPCVTLVMASGGYPGAYETGFVISGLEEAAAMDGVAVFHAGTRLDGNGQVVTAGEGCSTYPAGGGISPRRGRGPTRPRGRSPFKDAYYRTDIALRVVES